MDYVKKAFDAMGINPGEYIVVFTDKGGVVAYIYGSKVHFFSPDVEDYYGTVQLLSGAWKWCRELDWEG